MYKTPAEVFTVNSGAQIQIDPEGMRLINYDPRNHWIWINKFDAVELAQEILRRYEVAAK